MMDVKRKKETMRMTYWKYSILLILFAVFVFGAQADAVRHVARLMVKADLDKDSSSKKKFSARAPENRWNLVRKKKPKPICWR